MQTEKNNGIQSTSWSTQFWPLHVQQGLVDDCIKNTFHLKTRNATKLKAVFFFFFFHHCALPPDLSPCIQSQTHNVEVCEDVSLRVLLVNLLNIRSDHHQQLQVCDIVLQSWSAEPLTNCYVGQAGDMIKWSHRTYRKSVRFECLALRQAYPKIPRNTQEGRWSSFDRRHDGKSWGKHRETYSAALNLCRHF